MRRFIILFATIWAVCISAHSQATGYAGLNYQVYSAGGPAPSYTQDANGNITNRTLLATGTVSSVNFNWGGNRVLNTGYDGVIVRFYGYVNVPTTGTYYFGGSADDGIRIKVGDTQVVNGWNESGGDFRQSVAMTLSAGVVPIELIYYENGGGALVTLYWYNATTGWQLIPSTSLATDSTFWAPQAPALCCGGSSAAFNVNAVHQSKLNTFVNRTTADSHVFIEQIGNSNTITVDQTGTPNNHAEYNGNGSYNTVNITQAGTTSTIANYAEVNVTGNSNTVNVTQNSTGGIKGAFVTVNDNNNTVTLQQKDNGSHYANINVSGGNKSVDVLQQGSANHMANVTLTGLQTGLSLTQGGSTQQFYSITHNCSTSGGCGTIVVQQGQ